MEREVTKNEFWEFVQKVSKLGIDLIGHVIVLEYPYNYELRERYSRKLYCHIKSRYKEGTRVEVDNFFINTEVNSLP
jgi:hypothetical protein